MKKILFGAAGIAALAALSAPAYAQPAGGRVEALVGLDAIAGNTNEAVGVDFDIEEEHVFGGIRVGYDMPMGSSTSVGIDLEATESLVDFDGNGAELRAGRDLYAGGRLSLLASDAGSLYVTAGYTNLRLTGQVGTVSDSTNLDGVRGGVGFQFNIGGGGAFAGLEYRYSNYEADVRRHQVAGGFGFRF